jgi:hypothetical protein
MQISNLVGGDILSHLETIREKLHKSMEVDKKDTILKLSQELDKIILEYIKENSLKRIFK